jgi:hypothetical protein
MFFWAARSSYTLAGVSTVCALVLGVGTSYRQFFYYSMESASGYSSAMSLDAPSILLAVALPVFAIMALLIVRDWKALAPSRAFVLLVLLWLAFKEGFVRPDAYHLTSFLLSTALIGCVLLLCVTMPLSRAYSALSIVISVLLASAFSLNGPQAILSAASPRRAASGLKNAFATVSYWHFGDAQRYASYRKQLAPDALPPTALGKLLDQPVDLVGYETNVVFANALRWKPQPVFQPYAAYTSALDALDRDELASGGARRELLTFATIDTRYPFSEEPSAYRELICNYALDKRFAGPVTTRSGTKLIILDPSTNRCSIPVHYSYGVIAWAEKLPVHTVSRRLAFLFVDVRYSLLGLGAKVLYKVPPVSMIVGYENGTSITFRVVPDVLADGLLVNPIPKTIHGALMLFADTGDDRVKTVGFTTSDLRFFAPVMSYRLEEVGYR